MISGWLSPAAEIRENDNEEPEYFAESILREIDCDRESYDYDKTLISKGYNRLSCEEILLLKGYVRLFTFRGGGICFSYCNVGLVFRGMGGLKLTIEQMAWFDDNMSRFTPKQKECLKTQIMIEDSTNFIRNSEYSYLLKF